MQITINHQIKSFEIAPAHVAELLSILYPNLPSAVAVAINNQVVPKNDWSLTPIQDQDQVLIIAATQGG